MGYSCAARAANLLGIITKMFATNGNPSILTISGKRYFIERGRENPDGAFTGTLYQIHDLPAVLAPGVTPCLSGTSTKVGRVRLGPEGFINAFPRMSCSYKREVEQMLHTMEEKAPDLLREWASGRI